jgi:hypothetical protein
VSLTLDGTAAARITASERGVAWLVSLEFTSGTVYFTTAPVEISSGGQTYLALGSLVDVANVQESAAMLAAALVDPAIYRGKAANLSLQLFDTGFQPAGAAVLRWRGYMDRMQISRTTGDKVRGTIEVQCSRAGMARARRAEGLRLTDAQQQSRYPGDTGLRYVRTLLETPSLWLSKRFQEI